MVELHGRVVLRVIVEAQVKGETVVHGGSEISLLMRSLYLIPASRKKNTFYELPIFTLSNISVINLPHTCK